MSLLEAIKKVLFADHQPQEKTWLFLSLFSKDNHLIASEGVVQSTKTLTEVLDIIYSTFTHTDATTTVVIDLVTHIDQQDDIQKLLPLSVADFGICLVSVDTHRSGVILPGTVGVKDMKQAIQLCKDKYQLSGKVVIYTFVTQRITLSV